MARGRKRWRETKRGREGGESKGDRANSQKRGRQKRETEARGERSEGREAGGLSTRCGVVAGRPQLNRRRSDAQDGGRRLRGSVRAGLVERRSPPGG